MPRRTTAMEWEAGRAMLSLAGVRMISQTNVTVNNGAENTYTVSNDVRTRRVACVHIGTGNGDIRFDFGATASATGTDWPMIPARYFVVDAKSGDVLRFFNTAGAPIVVYIMEID